MTAWKLCAYHAPIIVTYLGELILYSLVPFHPEVFKITNDTSLS